MAVTIYGDPTLNKPVVGLPLVDNTSDAQKFTNPNFTGVAKLNDVALPTATGVGASGSWGINITGTATYATYLGSTQQTNIITGKHQSMAMIVNDGSAGSFICRSSGAGDSNLAGIVFHNDAYAIKLGIRADGYIGIGGWSRAAWSWYSDPSGGMVAAGNIAAYSDPRLKENFKRVLDPMSILNKNTKTICKSCIR